MLSGLEADYLARGEQTIAAADVRDNRGVLQRVTLVLQYAADNEELLPDAHQPQCGPVLSEKLFSCPRSAGLLGTPSPAREDEHRRRAIISFAIHGSYTLIQEWINETPRTGRGGAGRPHPLSGPQGLQGVSLPCRAFSGIITAKEL